MDNVLLRFEGVHKTFRLGHFFSRNKIHAVWDANFKIENDPIVFTLVGESGSGKTTIANLLLRTIKPTKGTIWFMGKNIENYPKSEFIKQIQPVFQDPFETFNPLKKLETYFQIMLKKMINSKNKVKGLSLFEKSLNAVGLTIEDIKGRYPHELSGGQLQRLSIARSLLVNPKILVADEPVSMLDVSLRISILNLFRKLRDEKLLHVFYITHDLATAYYISDYIAVILKGNIVEAGPAEKLLMTPLHPYTQLLKESVPDLLDKEKKTYKLVNRSVESPREYSEQLCKFILRCPQKKDICDKKAPPNFTVDNTVVRCWLYQKGGV
ncbi:ABC transporter ATP-binding protein [Thermotoga profunda]|uniref:ABC transporter ATP-binding protein n=1 Tax=Thermotoga profunda TaxID=1508420 RepID=UPI000597B9CC|nr:ABC transporter ATP-binding protein [Thermotoga profunda]